MSDTGDWPFYATKSVRRNGNSGTLYMEKEWGLKRGDLIEVTVWKINEPSRKVTGLKKVSMRGATAVFFCSKIWGFQAGDLVTYKVKKVADDDGRVPDED